MFINYIGPRLTQLKSREFLLNLFTYISDRPVFNQDSKQEDGTIVLIKQIEPGVNEYGYYENGELINIPISKHAPERPFSIYDEISLEKGVLDNYTLDNSLTTTIGRFITNCLLLHFPFKSLIPYQNDIWDIDDVQSLIATKLLDKKITTEQYKEYLDNGYFIGHLGELCVPTLSERSLTTDPKIKERKKELFEKYKDQLNDPKTIAKIEKELIQMDKDWLKGDVSEGFYGPTQKKSFGVHRKKLFIAVGGISKFSTDGSVAMVPESLSEGWSAESFPALANESRKGSWDRGHETQKGGEMTKFVFRAFQDIKIIEHDCNTKRTIPIAFDEHLHPSMFVGRIIIGSNGSEKELVRQEVDSYLGKTVKLRSPMTCETKDGYCYKCVGLNYERLGLKAPGIEAIEITSKFMTSSLKSMHGTAIQVEDINPMDFIK